jgi:D-alanine-D-alanine ligase
MHHFPKLRVTVLAGGPDAERDVSLASGRAVAAALSDAGQAVHFADAMPDDLAALDVPCDVVFPAMHGAWGEGGPLQGEMESRGLAYVGSGPAAAVAMDKHACKQRLVAAGLPVPRGELVTGVGVTKAAGSVVIKPVAGGSSVDVFLRDADASGSSDIAEAVHYLVARYGRCLVEDRLVGREVTVGVLGEVALPPVWIDPKGTAAGWFDYAAKYDAKQGAAHRFDLPPEWIAPLQAAAVAAHQAVGCRDLSRVDAIVAEDGTFKILEINTMPGFTGRSLLPDAAREAGIDFPALCDRLVRVAANRSLRRAA